MKSINKRTKIVAVSLLLTFVLVLFFMNRGYSREELEIESKRDFEDLRELFFAGSSTGEYLRTRFKERGKLWEAASEAGIPEAELIHAECLRIGIPDLPDKESAFALYESAADSGLPWAIYRVGYCHYNGYGTPKSIAAGIEWVRKAHDLKFPPASCFLGNYFVFWVEPRNHQVGEQHLKSAYDGGYLPAAFFLGNMKESGEGTPQDLAGAIEKYEIASEGGCYKASERLCALYGRGIEIPKDLVKSHDYLILAAEQGHGESAFYVTNRFQNGYEDFVSPDPEKALQWCRKAAIDLGNAEAMSKLGYYYDTGYVVQEDKERARYWYQRAADRGSSMGIFNLAHCCLDGKGGLKDPSKGVQLMKKAAEMKQPGALNSLGAIYFKGEHVDRDENKAIELWTQAASLGNKDARKNLTNFENLRRP